MSKEQDHNWESHIGEPHDKTRRMYSYQSVKHQINTDPEFAFLNSRSRKLPNFTGSRKNLMIKLPFTRKERPRYSVENVSYTGPVDHYESGKTYRKHTWTYQDEDIEYEKKLMYAGKTPRTASYQLRHPDEAEGSLLTKSPYVSLLYFGVGNGSTVIDSYFLKYFLSPHQPLLSAQYNSMKQLTNMAFYPATGIHVPANSSPSDIPEQMLSQRVLESEKPIAGVKIFNDKRIITQGKNYQVKKGSQIPFGSSLVTIHREGKKMKPKGFIVNAFDTESVEAPEFSTFVPLTLSKHTKGLLISHDPQSLFQLDESLDVSFSLPRYGVVFNNLQGMST